MTFPADVTDLVFLGKNNWILSIVLTAVWILLCNDESKSYP